MSAHVDRHFAGTISPAAERAMREHLATCDPCRDLYGRRLVLARLDPRALPPEERLARGLGLRSRPSAVAMGFGLAAAATAVAVLCLRLHPGADGFSARGNVGTLPAPASRVFVYEIAPGKPAVLAGDTLRRGDELAFAYQNGAGRRRLLVFGVDEQSRVYWFHPAWTSEGDDPVAIPIETDGQRHELPEAIRQPFDGERLEIRSLFVDDAVPVREVEALLAKNPRGPLPIPGAVETSVVMTVVP